MQKGLGSNYPTPLTENHDKHLSRVKTKLCMMIHTKKELAYLLN